MAKLREKGVSKVADVKRAYFEPDGDISVIRVGPARADDGPDGSTTHQKQPTG